MGSGYEKKGRYKKNQCIVAGAVTIVSGKKVVPWLEEKDRKIEATDNTEKGDTAFTPTIP